VRLSYANVMSTLFVVLALGGATAVAAKQVLPKKSVGTKQLKANAVTTAKIKKNAVTKAKIRRDAVDGSKIVDGSVTGTEINAASTPFGRIVHEGRGNGTVALPGVYPLANPVYTQEPGRDDRYVGALDITFESSCLPPRSVSGFVVIDPADPTQPSEYDVVAYGVAFDTAGGTVSKRIHIGPFLGQRFQPTSPGPHTLYLFGNDQCSGASSGVTATYGAVDVISTG
jgi:hypothetical protein